MESYEKVLLYILEIVIGLVRIYFSLVVNCSFYFGYGGFVLGCLGNIILLWFILL